MGQEELPLAGSKIEFFNSLLDLLRQVTEELIIPEVVYEVVYNELVSGEQQRLGAVEVQRATWIRRRESTNPSAINDLPSSLHAGERHAILLAQELGLSLLIDERRGRRVAEERGVEVFGSLWILAEAKRQGVITHTKPLVAAMLTAGYWIDEALLLPFFQELGEGTA